MWCGRQSRGRIAMNLNTDWFLTHPYHTSLWEFLLYSYVTFKAINLSDIYVEYQHEGFNYVDIVYGYLYIWSIIVYWENRKKNWIKKMRMIYYMRLLLIRQWLINSHNFTYIKVGRCTRDLMRVKVSSNLKPLSLYCFCFLFFIF